MKVFVYFNLHKRCFSIKALEGQSKGRVIAHRWDVILYDPVFKVSEAGRKRVLHEKRKNVHAGVVGNWNPQEHKAEITVQLLESAGEQVTYNPYKYDAFVYKKNEQKVDQKIMAAAMHSDGIRATIHVSTF